MIRDAVRRDIPALVAMAGRFHAATPIAFLDFDPAAAAFMAGAAVGSRSHMAKVLEVGSVVGALIASAGPHPLGRQIIAKEVVFWIEPEHRGKFWRPMIAAYEEWARGMGAVACGLSCFADGRTHKVFERAGFTPAEINTIKRV